MTKKYTLSGEQPVVSQKDRERFIDRIDVETAPDGCYNWKGSCGNEKDPRGKFQAQSVQDYAYRWTLVLAGLLLKKEHHVSHKCNNSKCVRINHLEVTDHQGNMEHMVVSDRHGHARLTVRKAKAILREWAAPDRPKQETIAHKHSVDRTTVSKLVNGHTWRSLRRK